MGQQQAPNGGEVNIGAQVRRVADRVADIPGYSELLAPYGDRELRPGPLLAAPEVEPATPAPPSVRLIVTWPKGEPAPTPPETVEVVWDGETPTLDELRTMLADAIAAGGYQPPPPPPRYGPASLGGRAGG